MKKFRLLTLLFLILVLYSCSTLKEGFINPKKDSSDEFLVEKKSPLVMPPDFDDLPNPNNENVKVEKDNTDLQDLISNKKENSDKENVSQNQDFEESILEKIQNN